MNKLMPVLAAACFALSAPFAFAQAPSGGAKPQMTDQERKEMRDKRQEMRSKMKGAWEACKDKPDRRACMMEQRCANAADKAKCQADGKARMTKRMEERQKAHEACSGKRGDELKTCLKANRPKHRHHDKKG